MRIDILCGEKVVELARKSELLKLVILYFKSVDVYSVVLNFYCLYPDPDIVI